MNVGLTKHQEEKWERRRGTFLAGVRGTTLVHFYEIPSRLDVDSTELPQSLALGSAMPGRPSVGTGATATIESVSFSGRPGQEHRVVTVVGFEADAWEE